MVNAEAVEARVWRRDCYMGESARMGSHARVIALDPHSVSLLAADG